MADLNEVVTSLQPMLKSLVGETVRLKTQPATSPCPANIDRIQTETAIMNLCINARDAMPQGGVLKIETGFAGTDVFGYDAIRFDPKQI